MAVRPDVEHVRRASSRVAAMRRMAHLASVDREVRAAKVSREHLRFLDGAGSSAIELIARAFDCFGGRPCLGTRSSRADEPFSVVSYAELWRRVVATASGLQQHGIANAGDLVGICGCTSVDWIVADLACLYLGAISVPLPRNMGLDDLTYLAQEAELASIVCARDELSVVVQVAERCPTIRSIVVTGGAPGDKSVGRLELHALQDIERQGQRGDCVKPFIPTDDAALFSVVYTSGSTGRPKGVMLTAKRWAETLRDSFRNVPAPTITVGYLPLTHMAGRISVYSTIMIGGRVNLVAEQDMPALFDAIRATRPTVMTLVPRVSGMIHQQFLTLALRRNVDPTAGYDDPGVTAVLEELRGQWLGGRLCFATTGAAPTAPEIAELVSDGLGVHLVDTYGSTEVARVAVDGLIQPGIEYRLIDLPELGYTTKDLPYPRGELAVKSPRQTPGYFRNAPANAGLYDGDGFMRTGDIVEERAPRTIKWIDRKNDVIRLANGEFINVARLEALFAAQSPYIDQVFVFGEATREFLVAVVVPSRPTPAEEAGANTDAQERQQALTKLLRGEVERIASEHRLPSHEIPRDFIMADAPFSHENGLLSDAKKYRRPKIKELYLSRLNELYKRIAERQVHALVQVAGARDQPVDDRVRAAVAAVLGRDSIESRELDRSFTSLGGDSLSAARLRAAVGESLDVGAVLDADTSLAAIIESVRAADASGAANAFERAHRGAPWARAGDFELAKFIPDALPVSFAEPAAGTAPKRFLLTGATGFLGHTLLTELTKKLGGDDCWVACVVRASDHATARARVARKLAAFGESAASALEDCAASWRVRVYAGDITKPRFGLTESEYARLSESVDVVLHCGALVNHLLSYSDLFRANVLGTAEVMRFAISGRRKRIHFVSTAGIGAGVRRRSLILEAEDAESIWPRRPVRGSSDDDYALGYTTSKWASEIMLSNLHRACGVAVDISRCSMILPHSELPHVFNPGDAFTRLVYGIVKTHAAPRSFYADGYGGDRHYDGLPVDVVARAIVEICCGAEHGLRTFHVCNSNWNDGVSIDTVTAWIESAGYRLDRLEHSAWHAEFVRRLARLPKEARDRSPEMIAQRWREPIRAGRGGVKLDTANFRAVLSRIGLAQVPSLAEGYVHRCLAGICGAPT